MRKKFALGLIINTFFVLSVLSQDTLLFEDFASSPGAKPLGWTTGLEVGDRRWQFVNGGGTKDPGIPGSRKPPSAYSDTVNALFFYESLGGESVFLITPPVDLEFAIKPELRFAHVQREGNLGFGAAHDELRVYYKTGFTDPWIEANKLAEFVDEVTDWTGQVVLLPEDVLVPECYFAFKATTRYGWGVGIDDVGVFETDFLQRTVDSVKVYDVARNIIPAGSRQNPVLRMDIAVSGNSGDVPFSSLEVTSMNSSDNDIPANGVKLHVNNRRDFYSATVVDSTSFLSGKATFSALDVVLESGYTYVWVSVDVKEDAVHMNTVDAMMEAGSVVIAGDTYPPSSASPGGSSVIRESVFFDDFRTDLGWVLEGDFQRGKPNGLGGVLLGSPDPLFAAADSFVLGNDLTGMGLIPGDYEPNVLRYANLATSPMFDLTYYNDVRIDMLRWLNVANNDTTNIELSTDGGSSWKEVWANDNNVFTDGTWRSFGFRLPAADRSDSVMLRVNLGPTTETDHFSGWNIDNFAVTGNFVEYDVGPTVMLNPGTGCGHTTSETVSVRLENYGPSATPGSIPLRYSFDGGASYVYDTLKQSIAFGGNHVFDFQQTVDLTAPGEYHVIIETLLEVDDEPVNNTWDTILYTDPSYSVPYFENFENGRGFWRGEGTNSTLEYGRPLGSIIYTAPSGTNAWVTNLDGDHADNEESYLVGPCFDLTGIDYPVFEFKIFYYTDDQKDGANVEYSIDNGQTWSRLGDMGDGSAYNWNWYNSDAITALQGGHGWTGPGEDWQLSRILMDTLVFRNNPSVKFRIRFESDSVDRIEGMAIDDIRIYDAPKDIGVVSIESPVNGCAQETGDRVVVTIQNFGLDTLMAGDTILAGFDLQNAPTVVDTIVLLNDLLAGAEMSYTFNDRLDLLQPGPRDLSVFTLLPDDVNFFNEPVSNDTANTTFEVLETPVTSIPDHIYTVRPDTVVLDASIAEAGITYLWQDGSTDPEFSVSDFSDGVYSVTTSNGFCEYRDTTYVWRLIADAGISSILWPGSDCELGEDILPVVEITNYGTDTLYAGNKIPVRYQLDGNTVVEETAVIDRIVLPDSAFTYSFTTPADMSVVKTYNLLAYTELPYDETPANDDLSVFAEVFGYTPLDLGGDRVVRALQYTLDAGAVFDTYQWNDGSNGQTLDIDTSGVYSVTVQQGTMCPNSDTIEVRLVVPDLAVNRLSSPQDVCGSLPDAKLEFYVQNTGTDTLLVNDTVYVSFSVNSGEVNDDILVAGRRVEPGDSLFYASDVLVDMSSEGSYQFSVDITFPADLVPANDHLDQEVNVYGAPELSLGNDTLVFGKTLLIDPGPQFISYLWQDGSMDQQFTASADEQTPDSIYYVTVTDGNGCEATDEIKVGFDVRDLGVVAVVNPESDCILDEDEEFIVRIRNEGTYQVFNETLTIRASLTGKVPVNNSRTITQPILPGEEVDLSLGTPFGFGETGDYFLRIVIIYGPDGYSANDTLETVISHYGNPTIELPEADTLNTSLPYTIDAGDEFSNYLWNGTSGSGTYEIESFGLLRLEVLDENGCSGTDSVYVLPPTTVQDRMLDGNLHIYPHPAIEVMYVEYAHTEFEDFVVELFDAAGRMIYIWEYKHVNEIREEVDVSRIHPGMYYLRIRSANEMLGRKIVVGMR